MSVCVCACVHISVYDLDVGIECRVHTCEHVFCLFQRRAKTTYRTVPLKRDITRYLYCSVDSSAERLSSRVYLQPYKHIACTTCLEARSIYHCQVGEVHEPVFPARASIFLARDKLPRQQASLGKPGELGGIIHP